MILENNQVEDERWRRQQAVLRRAAEDRVRRRKAGPTLLPGAFTTKFEELTLRLDDPAPQARNEAVRALYELAPERAASFFNLALRERSATDRRKIGAALAGSGLVAEALEDLMGESPENSYSAFSFLFLVAKAGEVKSLVQVIKDHPSIELRLTLIKLLATSGSAEIEPTFRLLASADLPAAVRSAITETLELRTQNSELGT